MEYTQELDNKLSNIMIGAGILIVMLFIAVMIGMVLNFAGLWRGI